MKDVKGYIERLDHSMTKREKLFFLNKINVRKYDYIVDFGCANGRLLYEIDKHIGKRKGNTVFIGVDNNPQLEIAYTYNRKFARVSSLDEIGELNGKVLLILSSVLHEVDNDTLEQLVNFAQNYATTIVIRDMHLQASNRTMSKEWTKVEYFNKNCSRLLKPHQLMQLSDFYNCTSDRYTVRRLYEYFLKYTYVENWETEKHESYFGRGKSNAWKFAQALSPEQFYFKYWKHYILPYKKKQVLADFGYKMRCNTHVKAIIQRKKPKSMRYIKRQLKR